MTYLVFDHDQGERYFLEDLDSVRNLLLSMLEFNEHPEYLQEDIAIWALNGSVSFSIDGDKITFKETND